MRRTSSFNVETHLQALAKLIRPVSERGAPARSARKPGERRTLLPRHSTVLHRRHRDCAGDGGAGRGLGVPSPMRRRGEVAGRRIRRQSSTASFNVETQLRHQREHVRTQVPEGMTNEAAVDRLAAAGLTAVPWTPARPACWSWITVMPGWTWRRSAEPPWSLGLRDSEGCSIRYYDLDPLLALQGLPQSGRQWTASHNAIACSTVARPCSMVGCAPGRRVKR